MEQTCFSGRTPKHDILVQKVLYPKEEKDITQIIFYILQDIAEHLREVLDFPFVKFDFHVFITSPSRQMDPISKLNVVHNSIISFN